MYLRTGAKILLGICEEIVRAGSCEKGAADFGIGDGELGCARGGTGAHELFWGMLAIIKRKDYDLSLPRSFLCSAAILCAGCQLPATRLLM
jgi:hypothetical protein